MDGRDIDASERGEGDGEGSAEEGFDLERVKELVGFAAGAPRRHPVLALGLFVCGFGLAIAGATFWPRTYESEVRMLAQRNFLIPALGNPNRAVPREADNPTQHVADTIKRRENLISLVKDVDLLDRWEANRAPILRLKDALTKVVFGPRNEQDHLAGLVGFVEKQLRVDSDENSVTISVQWPNAEMAYDLVTTVQKNFIEARYDADVAMINDALAILQQHAKDENENIGKALAELERAMAEDSTVPGAEPAPPGGGAPRPTMSPGWAQRTVTGRSGSAGEATARLLEVKRAEIKQIEDARDRQLAELNRRLQEAVVTQGLGPAHPTVLALKQGIEDASKPPRELATLQSDERALIERLADTALSPGVGSPRYNSPTGSDGAGASPPPSPNAAPPPIVGQVDPMRLPMWLGGLAIESPAVSVAKTRLRNATDRYTEIQSRLESARMELDLAKVDFKYRFSVVTPAEVPKRAKKPSVPLVIGIGLIASVLLALGAASAKDLMGGNFIELWQVRRRLNIPLLGEVDHSS